LISLVGQEVERSVIVSNVVFAGRLPSRYVADNPVDGAGSAAEAKLRVCQRRD
jgi:hypothetical protein